MSLDKARTVIIDPEIEQYIDPMDEEYWLLEWIFASIPDNGDGLGSFTELEVNSGMGFLRISTPKMYWVFHTYTDDTLIIHAIIDVTNILMTA